MGSFWLAGISVDVPKLVLSYTTKQTSSPMSVSRHEFEIILIFVTLICFVTSVFISITLNGVTSFSRIRNLQYMQLPLLQSRLVNNPFCSCGEEALVAQWATRWPTDLACPGFEHRLRRKSFQAQTRFHCTQPFIINLPWSLYD